MFILADCRGMTRGGMRSSQNLDLAGLKSHLSYDPPGTHIRRRQATVCKARFRSFHIVRRCVFASLDSRVFWLLSLSTLIAALWFCLLCPTIGK